MLLLLMMMNVVIVDDDDVMILKRSGLHLVKIHCYIACHIQPTNNNMNNIIDIDRSILISCIYLLNCAFITAA